MSEVFDSCDSDTNNSCSAHNSHNSDSNHGYIDFIPCKHNISNFKPQAYHRSSYIRQPYNTYTHNHAIELHPPAIQHVHTQSWDTTTNIHHIKHPQHSYHIYTIDLSPIKPTSFHMNDTCIQKDTSFTHTLAIMNAYTSSNASNYMLNPPN